MVHQLIHVALLVEICKALGKAVDEDTRIRRLDVNERIGAILVIDGNKCFANRGIWPQREVAALSLGYRVRDGTVNLHLSKQSSMCEKLAPEKQGEGGSNGDVDAIFNIREDGNKDTSKEDDDF